MHDGQATERQRVLCCVRLFVFTFPIPGGPLMSSAFGTFAASFGSMFLSLCLRLSCQDSSQSAICLTVPGLPMMPLTLSGLCASTHSMSLTEEAV